MVTSIKKSKSDRFDMLSSPKTTKIQPTIILHDSFGPHATTFLCSYPKRLRGLHTSVSSQIHQTLLTAQT